METGEGNKTKKETRHSKVNVNEEKIGQNKGKAKEGIDRK